MLTGGIIAGVDQIVHLEGQVGTVIDTILSIARATCYYPCNDFPGKVNT